MRIPTAWRLPRDGKRPISFAGLLLAEHCGQPTTWDYRDDWGGLKGTSYYDLAVYHTADGSYIVYWSYSGRRDGDILHHAVGTFTDLDAAIDALETWLLLDSRVVNVPMAYSPTFVTLSSVKPFFFHGLQNA